ncbi:MAG: excinuclease ABC subunit UvrC [Magnetococcales bacterium]|nr:excinuclease ABC subunit UvrC [Magnetococcales bacterium]
MQEQAAALPLQPGVYRFLDSTGDLLYIGKAKQLRRRVLSYFARTDHAPRTQSMLQQAQQLEITLTANEIDALVLEATLIQRHRPRYNVLLKDNKSYPWLHLTTDHPFPRLTLYRGQREEKGRFFGPYPSTQAVRETLKLLQRLFLIRPCDDHQFASQRRPCLQYQIKRCSAPCCDRITAEQYALSVHEVVLFLSGRSPQLIDELTATMWHAAEQRYYEQASQLRDRIKTLRYIQQQRQINLATLRHDVDLVALYRQEQHCAIQVFFIRNGINLGHRAFFPEQTDTMSESAILETFLLQFYLDKQPASEIIVSHAITDDEGWLRTLLKEKRAGAVTLHQPKRGEKWQLMQMACANAQWALERKSHEHTAWQQRLEALAERLKLPEAPQRIEVYDISHHHDDSVVGAMVVCGPEGLQRDQYRRFAIQDDHATDDTARMATMIRRRCHKLQQSEIWPDLIVLDGGIGQLNAVMTVALELQLTDAIHFVALAKGVDRHAGQERIFLPHQPQPIILSQGDPVLLLLQLIRDEAHRCAVGYHRIKRHRKQYASVLDQITGIGPQRRKALLCHFASVEAIAQADQARLAEVKGISPQLAEQVYHFFRSSRDNSSDTR